MTGRQRQKVEGVAEGYIRAGGREEGEMFETGEDEKQSEEEG
jgi:hypothetical protein